tara:strand:- start:248 stop:541 length:294 start_codon:yes stop_codon:yes gene_type:complete
MCFRSPAPPPLPAPKPVDSPIEPVASRVAVGDQRKQKSPVTGDNRTTMGTPKEKKSKSGRKVTGGRIARAIAPRRLGTRSLQIPLLVGSTNTGNLNY